MNDERLVQMVNQISQFFESQPLREDAIAGVLDHVKRFWDPRMRAAIIRHAESDGAGLRDIARAAIAQLAADRKAATS